MKFFWGLVVLVFILSCSAIIQADKESAENIKLNGKALHLIFSHNINGETHPCGCRNFPLGGLPQVAGFLAELNKDTSSSVFYVDSGDTLFPSNIIPQSTRATQIFIAQKLAHALDDLGLKFLTPGDQDFAAGVDFLKDLLKTVKFKLLISNLQNETLLPHQKYALLTHQNFTLFLAGLVDPQILRPEYARYFTQSNLAVQNILTDVKKMGFNASNPTHRLVILSHSGMDADKVLANLYPEIHWIIGAHTQDFTQNPIEENKTQIVQVLSRNHQMGKISFSLDTIVPKDHFEIVEMREDWGKKINPNPWFSFLDAHKEQLQKIQLKEQLGLEASHHGAPYPKVSSCLQCHKAQSDFWQRTNHSVAFATLTKNKEEHNTKCIGCHSLGLNEARGFSKTTDVISPHSTNYWSDYNQISNEFSSVRSLNPDQNKVVFQKFENLNKKHQIKNNFTSVQCLNCHDLSVNHPENSLRAQKTVRRQLIQDKCLSCHTPDQSPEWYNKDQVNIEHFAKMYKKISCPRL